MGNYGAFTDDGLEYVITTPHPPRDWFNYLWNEHCVVSAGQNLNGSGLYRNDDGSTVRLFGAPETRKAPRWVYIRDRESETIWSATYQPCLTEFESFECRHGLGYTRVRTLQHDISCEFRLFVPRGHPCEIWTIAIRNESRRRRRLSLFSVADIELGGAGCDGTGVTGLSARFSEPDNVIFFENMPRRAGGGARHAFMTSDRPIRRWDVSRNHFLGRSGNYACPDRIVEGKLGKSMAAAEPLVGALQHDVSLAAGAERSLNVVLGVVPERSRALAIRDAFESDLKVQREFRQVRKEHLRRTEGLHLETPDEDVDRLFNVWFKHQLHLVSEWPRHPAGHLRDLCQAAAALSLLDATLARERVAAILNRQHADGSCPAVLRPESSGIRESDETACDASVWISHAIDAVLNETGDLSFLDEVIPYAEADAAPATVWEHNLQSLEHHWNDRGERGLCLMHEGDWNELMDKVGNDGKGESVWLSLAFAWALNLTADMADRRDDSKTAALCRRRFTAIRKRIIKSGLDGHWFLYAVNDDGEPVGTERSEEGRIFLNPQTWALLSGVIDADVYRTVAEAIEPLLDTPVGPRQCAPAYTRYQPGIGRLSGMPAGFAGNGNVDCVAAAYKVAADFEAGRVEKAFDTLCRILPSDERCEPYAQCHGYVGPAALRMRHHVSDDPWLTSAVAVMFINCVDRLLGFRRHPDGFRLQPRLPRQWPRVRLVRPFRGTDFDISIRRGKSPGLTLDGQAVDGDFIAVPRDGLGRSVEIKCVLASD